MNKNKKRFLLATAFTGLSLFSILTFDTEVKAAGDLYGCNPSPERLAEVDTSAEFQAYIADLNLPFTKYITKAGKDLSVNASYARNNCLIVYGSPGDVKPDGKKVQEYLSGQPKFLGYTEKGRQYPNPDYPDVGNDKDYVGTRPFIMNPWDDSALKTSIDNSPTKPDIIRNTDTKVVPTYVDPKTKTIKTKQQELDRAYDRFYIKNGGGSLGNRGYFPEYNSSIGKTLVGNNLYYYASVSDYPDKWSAGVFTLYFKSTSSGVYWSSSHFMPPYKILFSEKRDLNVVITGVRTSPVVEGYNYSVDYKVCNLGDVPVKNPVISWGLTSSATEGSKTINITLDEAECSTGSIGALAPSVTADTTKTFTLVVNKSRTNPTDEVNWTNNTDTQSITVKNKVIDGSIVVTSYTPTYPHSDESITVNYKVCNQSNVEVRNVTVSYGFVGTPSQSRTISYLDAGDCVTLSSTHNTPIVKAYTGGVVYNVKLGGFSGDVDASDNGDSQNITVRNPDAKVNVVVTNDSSDNRIGDAKVKVENRTWNTINEDCSTSGGGCKGGGAPTKYSVKVYDTNFTTATTDDRLVATYAPTYSLTYSQTNMFTIPRSLFLNWVNVNYPDTYRLVQFRIATEIPHYTREFDWFGNPLYTNNKDEDILNYFPPRPSIVATECNTVEHSIASYFNTPDGFKPIKACAGHYPTYPSTTIESGMQAYHYVLYRFFALPIPKYTVFTPESDSDNPNHFSQLLRLPSTEANNVMGDFESMFIPNKTSNGFYKERGRYMPTGGTFNFEVFKKNKDASKGQIIALGTVSYSIPASCYDYWGIDIKHQYACDEIMFFLPNPDVATKKYEKPSSYTSTKITYPISGTKIPYLNPGTYTFDFKANETFRYYYQTNLINTGYSWGFPKFK
ncbi:hypothetical protein MZM54_04660 [[Brevibacterium] frigoritolerans]|nr:hypothetical protein [Peribacillus frigoritolerans]